MKKKEFLPLKIKEIGEKYRQKTEKGQVETAVGVFLLSLLTILVYAVFQAEAYRASAQYMEDALAASNLASAIIDVEEYGITRNMIIGDPILAFDRYCTALKGNLRLDDDWQCENKRLISGKVEITDYVIYNRVHDKIYAFRVGEKGVYESWQGTVGSERAPNGAPVESTGVYSEISFPVKGVFGMYIQAEKGKLVDIVLND